MTIRLSPGLQRLSIATLTLIYFLSLLFLYVVFIAPVFGYMGFSAELLSIEKTVESALIAFILALMLPREFKVPSEFLVFLFFVLSVVPVLVLLGAMDESRLVAYCVSGAFVCIILMNRAPAIELPAMSDGYRLFWLIVFGLIATTLIWIFVSGASAGFSLNLAEIYSRRSEQGGMLGVGAFAYITNWAFKVANPALIVVACAARRWALLLILIALQVFFFGVTAHKSIAAIPLIVVGSFLIMRAGWRPQRILGLALVGLWSSYGLAALLGLVVPASYIIRRSLFVPADLHFAYFDFFGRAGFVQWGNSILSRWVDYPFEYSTPRVMSMVIYGHPEFSANAGFLAAGYMHFGLLGVVLFTLFAGLLLRVADGLSEKQGAGLTLSILLPGFLWLFTSSDLTTSLLTHGLLLSLMLLWLGVGTGRPNWSKA